MANLWEETLKTLVDNGKTFDDVLFIQGDDFEITKVNFEEVAKKTNYDGGYGAQHVATDLVLVGKDWWIERYEYDGAEWWDFKSIPEKKKYTKNITKLGVGMWDTLAVMNNDALNLR